MLFDLGVSGRRRHDNVKFNIGHELDGFILGESFNLIEMESLGDFR